MLYLKNDSGLFQEVSSHVGADDVVIFVEQDLDEFAESRGVVVAGRFRVSYGFHYWRRGEHFFLDLGLLRRSANGREVTHRVLRGHSLARARFPGHDNRLVVTLPAIIFKPFKSVDVKASLSVWHSFQRLTTEGKVYGFCLTSCKFVFVRKFSLENVQNWFFKHWLREFLGIQGMFIYFQKIFHF